MMLLFALMVTVLTMMLTMMITENNHYIDTYGNSDEDNDDVSDSDG